MYCPKCGAEVDEDDVYCRKCGASLKNEDVTQQKVNAKKESEFISPLDKASHKIAHYKYLWNVLLFFVMALVWSLFVIAPFYSVNGNPVFYGLSYDGVRIGFRNIMPIWFSGLAILLCCICVSLAITRYRYYLDTDTKRHRKFFIFWIVIASLLLISAAVLFYFGTYVAQWELVRTFNNRTVTLTYSFGYGTPLFYFFMFGLGGLYIALISYQQFHNRKKKQDTNK